MSTLSANMDYYLLPCYVDFVGANMDYYLPPCYVDFVG